MPFETLKTFGAGRQVQQFIGTEAEKVAKTDNVVGDIFYTHDEAESLVAAFLWGAGVWNKFEEYFV